MKILSFGEIIWDVYPHKKCIGGAPLNFAAHVLKSGEEAYLLSSVGNDLLGKEAISILESLGVNYELVTINCKKSTGTCTVLLDKEGIPSYTIDKDRAYDYIMACDDIPSYGFDAISYGTLALRSQNNKHVLKDILNKNTGIVFCDLNLRYPFYDVETVKMSISLCDILKINEDELKYVLENIVGSSYNDLLHCLKLVSTEFENLKLILYTCGENGAYAYRKGEDTLYFCPAKKVKVVSTVGAGDSFGAVFLTEYLKGENIDTCLIKATERSGRVVACDEAVPLEM